MFGLWPKRATHPNESSEANQTVPPRLIELRGVVKEYATAAGPFPALRGIDLAVDAGQLVGVVGRSGAGKTTLVNMIAGLDRPTRGEVYVCGAPVHRLGEDDLAAWRGRSVGIVFQSFQLLPNLSNLDNVMLPMDFAGRLGAGEQRERAMMLLAAVDVAEQAGKLPSAISGGQQQRVAIARALANDPPLLLADEPTGNLDSKTADSILDLFHKLASEGKTVLLISHDPDLASRVTRTIAVSDGTIVDDRREAPPALGGTAGRR
jgi:putative ABC transport system ATP-binding protein